MTRFIVFGVDKDTETLIQNKANSFDEAVLLWDYTSSNDYKARIWDNKQQGFVKQTSIGKPMR